MIYEKNSFIYCDCDSAGTSCILCIARDSRVSRRATYAGQVPTPGQCGCSTKVGVVLLPV
jgi:hypothetical protein